MSILLGLSVLFVGIELLDNFFVNNSGLFPLLWLMMIILSLGLTIVDAGGFIIISFF